MGNSDWYGKAQSAFSMQDFLNSMPVNQSMMRLQGDIQVDSGTFQEVHVKGNLLLDNGGSITSAQSYPANFARTVMGPGGFSAFNSTPVQTVAVNIDGSGFLGIGSTQISWTTAGVMTIPVAAIGALTIAQIGGGVLGGTYKTATGTGARLELDTGGLRAYNSSNVQTAILDATTGALTITGTMTVNAYTGSGKLILNSTGSFGDVVQFQHNGTNTASIYSTGGALILQYGSGGAGSVQIGTNFTSLLGAGSTEIDVGVTSGQVQIKGSSAYIQVSSVVGIINNTTVFGTFTATGAIYPSNQTSRGITDDGTQTVFGGQIKVTGQLIMGGFIFLGSGLTGTSASGTLPSPTKWLAFATSTGTTYYVPGYAGFSPWSA